MYCSLKRGFHISAKSQTIGDFTVSRLSQILPTNENSKSKISRSSGMDGNKSGETGAFLFSRRVQDCWAPVPLSQISVASLENLGQTSGDYLIYRQNLGWWAKSKIPDRLGFSRHMKTRLHFLPENYITK